MNVDPLAEKYRAFNWNVLEIDGHDMDKILEAFEGARANNSLPTLLIAHTVKGKGVSFMENEAGWHGVAPNRAQFEKAIVDLATPRSLAPASRCCLPGPLIMARRSHARQKIPCRPSAATIGGMQARR